MQKVNSSIKDFKGVKVVRASALAQSEVLSLLSAPVIAHLTQVKEPINNFVDEFLLLFVIGMPFERKQRIVSLLMSDMKDKDGIYVDVETFNGRMVEFHKMLADVIHWNLHDFFTYIGEEHKKDLPMTKAKKTQ